MFSRKAATRPNKDKASSTGKLGILRISGTQKTLICTLVLFLTLFIIFSLYTSLSGAVGAAIADILLKNIGGAVIIPLLIILYVDVAKLFSKDIPCLFRQFCGTCVIFITAALLLGLNVITNAYDVTSMPCLGAGVLGIYLAENIVGLLGAIGTLFAGLIAIYISLLLYKIPVFTNIKLPKYLANLRLPTFPVHSDSGNTDEDEPVEQNDDEINAVNITEFDGKDYFNSGIASESDEKTDIYVDGGENIAVPQIQDPSFTFDKDGTSKVKAGVFPPPIEIFGREESRAGEMNEEKALPFGEKIIQALAEFNIEANLAEILVGPTVIQFRIQLAPGIKVNRVSALANDIALAMAVPSLRIEAPIPGKPYVGIEIPNPKRRGIPLRTVIADDAYQNTDSILPLPFGVAVNGDAIVIGLEDLPHLLVAGTTGSGKSVFVNSCIVGLCSTRTPDELRMILVDPKRVEMAVYDKLPHLLTPPVTDAKKAVRVLAWAIREMEKRYSTFAKSRVRNLESFNERAIPKDRLPSIVIVVDELADLMMTASKEVEDYICRLAQMARATGIHLMLATQRPSVNVITGLIKANIPARVAFTLPSSVDSRTIIDSAGAEKLLGKGDMLFMSTKYPKPIRIQSPWVDEKVLSDWLDYMTNTFGAPDFIEIDSQGGQTGLFDSETFDDDMLEDAIDTVLSTGIASASGLQRRLRVGFSRASRLIDMMEQLGIVGPADGARAREILVDESGAKELLDNARDGND